MKSVWTGKLKSGSLHTIIENRKERNEIMKRKLVIEGNAVYEIDEECMLRNRLDREKEEEKKETEHEEVK